MRKRLEILNHDRDQRLFVIHSIDYDDSGCDDDELEIIASLPQQFFVVADQNDENGDGTYHVMDAVSDRTGFCIKGCEIKEITSLKVAPYDVFVSKPEEPEYVDGAIGLMERQITKLKK